MNARHLATLCVVALAVPFFFASRAAAQENDEAVLAKYRLTDDGLARFTQATRNLGAAVVADPGLKGRMEQRSELASDDPTIGETAAFYDAEPAVRKALESAGMSSEEYVTFMYSIMQAAMGAWAVEQQGELPEGTPEENVDYYRANAGKIAALSEEMKALEAEGD